MQYIPRYIPVRGQMWLVTASVTRPFSHFWVGPGDEAISTMHTASHEFLTKPEESAKILMSQQTLSLQVGSEDETSWSKETDSVHLVVYQAINYH